MGPGVVVDSYRGEISNGLVLATGGWIEKASIGAPLLLPFSSTPLPLPRGERLTQEGLAECLEGNLEELHPCGFQVVKREGGFRQIGFLEAPMKRECCVYGDACDGLLHPNGAPWPASGR